MTPENEDILRNTFPFYKIDPRRERRFTFTVGDGWFQILFDLSKKIEEALKEKDRLNGGLKTNATREPRTSHLKDFRVVQVKEKFGGLRFYVSQNFDDDVRQLIADAERQAGVTCEDCGKPGSLRNKSGWVFTACDEHGKDATPQKEEEV